MSGQRIQIKYHRYLSDKPTVRLAMSSPSPVLETDHKNVTLTCEVDAGNPELLDEVIWYLDGEVLKHLPECNGSIDEGKCFLYKSGGGTTIGFVIPKIQCSNQSLYQCNDCKLSKDGFLALGGMSNRKKPRQIRVI